MLIDRILGGAPLIGPEWLTTRIADLCLEAHAVDIDNVSDYLYTGTDQEVWNLESDFPNMAPPFATMFLEHKMPTLSRSNGQWLHMDNDGFKKTGVLIVSQDLDMPLPEPPPGVFAKTVRSLVKPELLPEFDAAIDAAMAEPGQTELRRWQAQIQESTIAFLKEKGIRWHSSAIVLLERQEGIVFAVQVLQSWNVMRDGAVAPGSLVLMGDGDDKRTVDAMTKLKGQVASFLYPSALALSMMHCKNVTADTVTPDSALNKARARRNRPPLVSYDILNINPMKTRIDTVSRDHSCGTRKALHICRGHFKDFSNGPGLFGKQHGFFWWEMSLRGSAQRGIHYKDYKVSLDAN